MTQILPRLAAVLSLALVLSTARAQTTYYLDFSNSGNAAAQAGFGTNTSFTWDSSGGNKIWNSDNTGNTTSAVAWASTSPGNNAVLGSGSGTSTYTATLGAAVTVGTISTVNGTWQLALSTFNLTFDSSTNSSLGIAITSGSGALIKNGSSLLTINSSNSYTGGTTLNAGTLALGNSGAIGSSGTITFGGGTLQYTSANTTDYSSRFSTSASQQYKIDTNGQSVAFATALNSSGATLAKSGGGTLTLSNTNTYSGATTISAGILNLTGSIASSTVSVASGGTLAGSGTASGAVTLSSGGHISPGSSLVSNSVGTLSLGSLTWAAGGVMDFNLGSTSASADKVSVTGAITKSGSGTFSFDFGSSAAGVGQTYTVASAGSWIGWGAPNTDFSFNSSTITGGSFAFNGNNLEFAVTSAIPEPSTYAALAGLGALGLAMYRRRQARETSKLAVTASV